MNGPLVSCVMPTADRRRWVPQAIRLFQRQDYANRELLIVDDGMDGVADLVPGDSRIRYLRIDADRTLGEKRNLCVTESRGELILHWDDDDWFAPHRIRCQVDALLRADAEICGLPRMLFHELQGGRTWLYERPAGERPWLAGGSLLYTRDFWRRGPFPDLQVASDTSFVWGQPLDRAVAIDDHEIYVAMIHPGNTSPKIVQENWTPWCGDLQRIVGEDMDFYAALRAHPTKADIIVPTFGQESYTIRCFDSILAHTDAYRLVWVDNGSPAASHQAVRPAFERHRERLEIRAGNNLGFVGGTNLGLRTVLDDISSDAEFVVMLNNDTEVTPGWLERLTGALRLDPSLGAAGPMTSPSSSWQAWPNVFASWGAVPPPDLDTIPAVEAGRIMAERFADAVVPVSMIAFFCAAIRKRVFDEVGLLDPRFGAGLADDDDYCFRLRAAGRGIAFVPGAYVVHHHRTTFRAVYSDAEIAAMQHDNLASYRAKHRLTG